MKKITFMLIAFIVSSTIYGQCINTTQFGNRAATNNGTVENITTCNFAGEYANATNLIIGDDYQFASTGRFVTVTDVANNVLAFGPSPVQLLAITVDAVRIHVNTDDGCGTDATCSSTSLQSLTNIMPPPANDDCTGAIALVDGDMITESTLFATEDNAGNGTSANSRGIWYSFNDGGTASRVSIDLCGSDFDTELSSFTGACGALVDELNNDDNGPACAGSRSSLEFTTDGVSDYFFLATGFSGNTGEIVLSFTAIPDAVPPTVVTQDITVQLDDMGTVTILPADIDNGSMDDAGGSGIDTIELDIDTFDCSNVGAPVTVTLTVTDNAGNSASDTAVVTVEDDMDPDLVAQDATASIGEDGTLTMLPTDLVMGGFLTFDGNGITSTATSSDTPINIVSNATVEATASVSESGVIGEDFLINNVTIDITHTFDADLDIFLVSPAGTSLEMSTDNGGVGDNYTGTIFQDGGATIVGAAAPFTGTFQPEGGTFAATFAGEDINGTWTLQVGDDFAGDEGTLNSFEITIEELESTLNVPDNCGATATITPNMFTCADVGSTVTVTVTATDDAGNVVTDTAELTITDEIAPTVSGSPDIFTGTGATSDCSATVSFATPTAMDNCTDAADVVITQIAGPASGSVFPVGSTTVTFEASDDSGNIESYSFNVTVTDTAFPTIDCPGDFIVGTDDDEDSDVYTIPDWSSLASDNCSSGADLEFVQVPAAGETVADGSMTDVTLTTTDAAGNVTECTFILTVDNTLSTNDFALDNAISIYPNPVASQFTLRNGSNAQLQTITLSDVNGRVIDVVGLSDMTSEKQIDVSSYASGIYFAQISTGNATTVKRIVKQ